MKRPALRPLGVVLGLASASVEPTSATAAATSVGLLLASFGAITAAVYRILAPRAFRWFRA